jgi:peptidoglycan/LPS O-acetylase OafA/YrhL
MIKLFKIEIDSNRVFGLDVLRAFAILFVICQHAGNYLSTSIKPIYNTFILDGVSIFFVLSGFLIGRILIQLSDKSNFNSKTLFNFWKRRWLRTLPNYFLVLFVLIILNYSFNPSFSIYSIKKYFVFSQNLNSTHPWFFPEAWSLSIEEWFYVIIPICLFIGIKILKLSSEKSLLVIALSIIILVTLFRFYKYVNLQIETFGDWDLHIRKQVFTRLDSIMYGILGAYFQYYHFNKWVKHKYLFLWIGLVLLVIIKALGFLDLKPVNGIYNCVFSFSLFSLAILFLIPFLSNIKHSKGALSSFFSYTSAISYSMYILNLSIIQFWIIDKINWSLLNIDSQLILAIKYLLFLILTFALSTILYRYFELPIMKLRHKEVKP